MFLELPDGTSLLLAPDERVAEYVGSTYRFDRVEVVPVEARRVGDRVVLAAGPLQLEASIGAITLLGRLLRIVPDRLAVHPSWLRMINPIARLLVPGAGTAGTAGGGRREFYGVVGSHAVTGIHGTWEGKDIGDLRAVDPPVQFGFASMPARPQIVDVQTTILS
ncbi:hypothetical protein [Curtobacterium sp. RRHDQ10]|uniref:hypothetical protein n=1 Tax=Curtobacterium phyllosphaerae TaxID=3413379 RepID=UPI003BF2E52E